MMKEAERQKILARINLNFLNERVKKIKFDDLSKILQESDHILAVFRDNAELYKYFDDVKLLLQLIKDFWDKKYTKIPYWSIAAIVFALLYVLNPIDLIPDYIPVAGFVDDALVVSLVLKAIREDLAKYIMWRESKKTETV